jgi:hypothetical protein
MSAAPIQRIWMATAIATMGSSQSSPVTLASTTPTITPPVVHTSVSR